MNGSKRKYQIRLYQILSVIGFICLWDGLDRFGQIPDIFISSPYQALVGLIQLIQSGKLMSHLGMSLVEIALAYALALSFGVGFGLIIGATKYLRDVFDPFLMTLHAMPKIAVFPLFIVWFGIDIELKVFFGAFHGFFIIIIMTIAGVKNVRKEYVEAALTMGLAPRKIYYRVLFPAAIPSIFTGLRIGMIGTVLGVLLAELVVSRAGVGFLMNELTYEFKTGELYGLTIVIALISILINEILRFMGERLDAGR